MQFKRNIGIYTGADGEPTNPQTDDHKQKQMSEEKQERMNEEETDQKNIQNIRISERFQNVVTESWHFMKNNRKARSVMIVNALIGAVSTLVLFFLQAKLPLAGLNEALLGPALLSWDLELHSAPKWWDIFQIGNTKSMLF